MTDLRDWLRRLDNWADNEQWAEAAAFRRIRDHYLEGGDATTPADAGT